MSEFQVRSDKYGTHTFSSFQQAYQWANKNKGWKISYTGHRWVKKMKGEIISDMSEDTLCQLSLAYQNCKNRKEVFWVDQPLIPDQSKENMPVCFKILEVCTDAEFKKLFLF